MPASFSSLPAELKANVLEHVARQEGNWQTRTSTLGKLDQEKAKNAHVDSLRAASPVNKEWWSLAAPFIFDTLPSQSTTDPLFRHRLLHKHGDRFKLAQLSCQDTDDDFENSGGEAYLGGTAEMDYALSILPLLPNLRSLELNDHAAYHLWGPELDIDPNRDDAVGMRSAAFETISKRIELLYLSRFRPGEAQRVLALWPKEGLRTLAFWGFTLRGPELNEGGEEDRLDEVAKIITSMRSLVHLDLQYVTDPPELSTGWSPDVLAALQADPPPLATLELDCTHLHRTDLDFIATFSSTLKHLVLRFHDFEDVTTILPPLNLPLLTTLKITIDDDDTDNEEPQQPLSIILPVFFSSPVVSLIIADHSTIINLNESCPLTILDKNLPTLRHLQVATGDSWELSLVAAFCTDRNLPAPTDDPFNFLEYDYFEGITDKDNEVACDSIDRLLDWGKLEVGRLRAGAKVSDSVALFESLRPLQVHRQRWKD